MGYFESSIFLGCLKKVSQGYLAIEEKLSSIYLSSFTHCLIGKGTDSIKIGFKFSIFGRLTQIDGNASRNFFETSKVMEILLNWISNLKDKTNRLSVTSNCVTSIRNLKYGLFSKPLEVGGMIIIATIITNLVLSIILQRQIALCGWLVRGLLLFIGISGLFCDEDWPTLKTSSMFFKKGDVSR